MTDKPKIYERNPITGSIRWRYVGEYSKNHTMTKEEIEQTFPPLSLSEKERQ